MDQINAVGFQIVVCDESHYLKVVPFFLSHASLLRSFSSPVGWVGGWVGGWAGGVVVSTERLGETYANHYPTAEENQVTTIHSGNKHGSRGWCRLLGFSPLFFSQASGFANWNAGAFASL